MHLNKENHVPKRSPKKPSPESPDAPQPALAEAPPANTLDLFHPAVRDWFSAVFTAPTRPQILGWPAIARGDSTADPRPHRHRQNPRCFSLVHQPPDVFDRRRPKKPAAASSISPRSKPSLSMSSATSALRSSASPKPPSARRRLQQPTVAIRTGDTPHPNAPASCAIPSDILITTPESLYLLLTSSARELLRSVETVILDEIHALVPTKRGSHLALSLERLERLAGRRLQRIGLSATQRPLEEVARFLVAPKFA